jgi:hypothetical protein
MTTTTGLDDDVDDDTTGDLDSPRPSATAKKRSYCREFKTGEDNHSQSIHFSP